MKGRTIIGLGLRVPMLLLGLCILVPQARCQSPVFSLFLRASKESPVLKALQKGPEEASLRREIEKRKGWPQVSFDTSFTLYDPHREDIYRDQEFLTTIDLDVFGKHTMKATALESEYKVAQEYRRKEKWHLFQQVARCYYSLVTSFERERLAEEELEWASKLYQKTRVLVKNGALPEVDLTKAEGELQEARLKVESASKEGEMALARMKVWIPDFSLATNPQVPKVVPMKVSQDVLFKALIRFSPQIKSLQAEKEKALKEARAERFSFLPNLKIQGGYVVHREEDDTGDYWMWSAGVSVPLFDGGVRERKIKLKKIEAEKMGFQMAALRRTLKLQADALIIALRKGYEKWKITKKEAGLFQSMTQKLQKAYSFGGVGIEELIRANRKTQEKRNKLLEISCDYNYNRDVISYIEQQGGEE